MKKLLYISIAACALLVSCKGGKELVKGNNDEKDDFTHDEKAILRNLFIDASMEITLGNDDRARELLTKVVAMDPSNAASFHELAKIEERAQNYGIMLDYAEKAYKLDPDNTWYLVHLATVYRSRREFEKAEELYKKAVDMDSGNLSFLFPYAEVLLYQNKIEEALEVFEIVEEKYGINPELSLQKHDLYMELGKPQDALRELQLLSESDPNNIQYLGMLAEAYERLGNREKAAETYERMLELDPGNGRVHLARYRNHLEDGNEEQAFEHLKQAYRDPTLGIDPKVQMVLDFYVLTEQDSTLLPMAYDLLDILVDVHPKEAKTYAVYGDFLIREQKDKEAREMFLKALMFDDDKYVIWNQVLLLDAKMKDWKSLRDHGEDAVTLFPNQPAFYYFLGYGHLQLGENDEAIDMLEMSKSLIIDDDGLMIEVLQSLGDAYYRSGMKDEAYMNYDQSLELDSANIFLLNNYSYYLALDDRELDKAADMAKRANELLPGQSSFQDTYGFILFKQGKFEESKKWLEKAVNGGSPSAAVLEHYGDVLYKLGKKEEAVSYWEKAIEKGGTSEVLMKKVEEKAYYEN